MATTKRIYSPSLPSCIISLETHFGPEGAHAGSALTNDAAPRYARRRKRRMVMGRISGGRCCPSWIRLLAYSTGAVR